jgi:hypothetical protein
MAVSAKVRNAHIKWLKAQVKSDEKDACKPTATEAAHKKAMGDYARHSAALARALEAKSSSGKKGARKGRKKKGRKRGRR